ncbi:fructosamine kinase family protein [Ideonella sp. 4Y16]|uniref:fructosamine kinase family protein n=1 Tax=Ideonella alba TaxID=2824118 RepID=UPI001B35C27E|nr:fructosamine kinase family protein [Ideonella alba]MBQ0945460.1 fructosamine kinase family protein [Ideonella alba]
MLHRALSEHFPGDWRCQALNISGLCETWRAEGPQGARLFIKTLPQARAAVLDAEADGLRALAAARALRVPAVAGVFLHEGTAVLALEWLDLKPLGDAGGAAFGAALAALHTAEAPARYGWSRGNWLGATPQDNAWTAGDGLADWLGFLATRRLRPLAQGLDAALVDAVERLIARLPALFDDGHVPRPSLIHGDLWSGNWGALADGTPVVFDPAVSVSDAEAELAMMELFGAPPPAFWPAYRAAAPLHGGYVRRRPVYQLVHLLNHARLFGGGYARQALAVAQRLIQ